jgi:hypothetical protein
MRMRHRVLRLATFVSVTALLVTSAVASEESATENQAAPDDALCVYWRGGDDPPELGPLPCDTSRPYMIGRQNLGRSPESIDSSEPGDGASASPRTDENTGRSGDVEAP